MKKLFFLVLSSLGLLLPGQLRAQTELSNVTTTGRGGVGTTFVTDYQAIGVNPANLGRSGGPRVVFSIGQLGATAGSKSLTREQVLRFARSAGDSLSRADKQELARAFTSDNALNVNAETTTFGLSVALPTGLGTLAISNRQRLSAHVALNQNAAELTFLGRDAPLYVNFNPQNPPLVSEALNGSEVQMTLLNEYNVAYGVGLLDLPAFRLTGGVGYRYIQGVGAVDVRVKTGDINAYSALSPVFKVDYGRIITGDPSFNLRTGDGVQPVGKGHGFDVGLNAEVGKIVRLGVAITDLGHMTWTGNLLTADDQKLARLRSAGVGSYDFLKEATEIFISGTDSLFQYDAASARRADLPTRLRTGVGLRVSEFLETGLDVTLPLNHVAGNLPSPFVGVGVDYKPVRWLRLSSGLSGGAGYGLSVPLGITIATTHYEGGISTRNVPGFFQEKNPYVSAAAAFLRFKIGRTE